MPTVNRTPIKKDEQLPAELEQLVVREYVDDKLTRIYLSVGSELAVISWKDYAGLQLEVPSVTTQYRLTGAIAQVTIEETYPTASEAEARRTVLEDSGATNLEVTEVEVRG